MKSKILTGSIIATYALLNTPVFAEETTLEPIVVSADFREAKLSETASSVTVIGEEEIYDKSTQSFIETLASTPNVNFSSGASKAKYIQIRGIGQRSQYETPINPSVGLMLDGIDFSNATLGVTMFDVKQIEVLRGPQGTTFGANGMAGVVSLESNEPTKETEGHLEATIGDYNTKSFGAAVGGTLVEDTLLGRISVYKNTSDGYMENSFLNRNDTQNIDELTTKAQLRWFASDKHTIDLNYIYVDINNGYDAWTFDNSRTSHADEPGKDTQETNAFSLKSTYQLNQKMHLISTLSYSDSGFEYSYDEDWSYEGEFTDALAVINQGLDCNSDTPDEDCVYDYSSFDQYLRDRKQIDIDVRLVSDEDGRIFNGSTDWTIGAYYKDTSEDLIRNYTYLDDPFTSSFDTTNKAIYGQLDTAINPKLTLVTGLRLEAWDAKYSDSYLVAIDTDETLVGGKLGLNYQEAANRLYYVSLSKGYKPGGVNANSSLDPEEKEYQTENLWNLEAGLNSRHFENKLISRLNIFYGKRKDQQVNSSKLIIRDDDTTEFIGYLSNAAEGNYYGLESELHYYPNESLHLYSSIGLLNAEFDEYINPETGQDMAGRIPAQSPEYQYNFGLDYIFADSWMFKTNLEGKGSYYFSNRHYAKSDSYTLLNSSLEYTNGNWGAAVWARNITDEDYQVRGFGSFGNNPSKIYATEVYTQQGAPRTVGLTVSYDF